jgi:hypothetical protein
MLRTRALRWLRVSERPTPPVGAGPSLTVFRASPRYLHLRRLRWALAQLGGLVGIIVSLAFFGVIDLPFLPTVVSSEITGLLARMDAGIGGFSQTLLGIRIGGGQILFFLETVAILGYLAQLVFSGLLVGLHWETHWYMVSDESLRIREGLVRLREQTMTVANIQNMKIRQDPIQRFLGLAELEVHTAGGGSKGEDEKSGKTNLHVGHFSGLADAWTLRDRLRDALARHRASGLGDPDDRASGGDRQPVSSETELGLAADALLAEARHLRTIVDNG